MRWVSFCLTVACVLGASRARADDPEKRADRLFHEGVAAGQRGEFEQSRAAFEASFAISPRGTTMRNMARSELEEGRVLDGLKHLKQALLLPDISSDATRAATVQADIAHVYATQVARIAVVADEGARLEVDGVMVDGTAPLAEPIDVLPGDHVLVASVGDRKVRATVNARVGPMEPIELHLPPDAPPVSIGGSAAGDLRPVEPWSSVSHPALATPQRSWWTPARAVATGLGVAAVASAAVGAYFEVASYSSAHDVEHARAVTTPGVCAATPATGSCITLMGKVSDTGTNTVASEIAYGVGAVFAAGAVVTWVLGGPRAATVGSMRVRPMVGPRSLGVNGTF